MNGRENELNINLLSQQKNFFSLVFLSISQTIVFQTARKKKKNENAKTICFFPHKYLLILRARARVCVSTLIISIIKNLLSFSEAIRPSCTS